MSQFCELCPFLLLQRWCAMRDEKWGTVGEEPLFCVTSADAPKHISYDSWRKAVAGAAASNVGTHSLRKGGAHWLKISCGVPDDVVQAQGGWASLDTMRFVYARYTDNERRDCLLQRASASTSALPLQLAPTAKPTSPAVKKVARHIWQQPMRIFFASEGCWRSRVVFPVVAQRGLQFIRHSHRGTGCQCSSFAQGGTRRVCACESARVRLFCRLPYVSLMSPSLEHMFSNLTPHHAVYFRGTAP